ncbi:hypothetical protein GOP47_0001435 [Adiantum capillus-veneris]|uniref:Beta-glucosidase n=1 Tax=Adiantum capillus-veneris TaxID=13818 RepID=A0A9D4V8V5_ADICA|nr:hypothetical protein GOP47_0001435 [Adiantum capillus-veneris]
MYREMASSMRNVILSLSLLVIAAHPAALLCNAARYHRSTALAASGLTSRSGDALFPNGTGVTRADFPEGFLFGAITSAMKHEGAEYVDLKTDNIWDVYARRDGASKDGVLPGECGKNYDLFKTDHKLTTGLGMNSYRFSIAWSRMLPNGTGEVNALAIAHYNDVIDDVIEQGLVPMVSLWTQDHPQVLEDQYGGALDSQFITDFVNYADACFKAFGDRVKYWVTFDEANDWAGLAFSTNQNPPGRCTSGISGQGEMNYGQCDAGNSATEPYIVGRNLLLAHAEAVDLYRTKYQASQNGSLGLALWFRWLEPLTNSSADYAAAQRANDFLMGWFLDPIFYGHYPDSMVERVGSRLPSFTAEEMSKIQGSLDFIGLNIQTASYVYERDFYLTQDEECYYLDWGVDITGERDGVPIGVGDTDYAVPWCIRKAVEYIKNRYDNFPMYITQTGWGITYNKTVTLVEETLNDDQRVEFFMTYYDELSQAIKEGANVKGVYAWSLLDGFEFNLGTYVRVGIFFVDSEYNRIPRKSALWFKEMLSQNATLALAA